MQERQELLHIDRIHDHHGEDKESSGDRVTTSKPATVG